LLTEFQINTLKNNLLEIKENSTNNNEEETYSKMSIQESSGELSMYDNHPADMGTALFEREKELALNEHAESELGKVDIALASMDEGTYGKCSICDIDIPYERLEAVPYTPYCLKHAEEFQQSIAEDVTINSNSNPFEETKDSRALDFENSFEEVAEFGSSDSPSDFTDSENPTYSDDSNETTIDRLVGKSLTNQTND